MFLGSAHEPFFNMNRQDQRYRGRLLNALEFGEFQIPFGKWQSKWNMGSDPKFHKFQSIKGQKHSSKIMDV